MRVRLLSHTVCGYEKRGPHNVQAASFPARSEIMVRHGTAKKRRRGLKVTRKAPKPAPLRVVNAVKDSSLKKIWDKSKTPAQNLLAIGLDPDANSGKKDLPEYADKIGYIGMIDVSEADPYAVANPRRKQMSDFDQQYITRCVAAHGQDYSKMERDTKVNFKLFTARQLEKMFDKLETLRNEKK
jgi:hypothetical protein